MKIKIRDLPFEEVIALPKEKRIRPRRPSRLIRFLLKTISQSELKAVNFKYETSGMEKLRRNEPALFLMNHSAFIDLKIASTVLYPRPFNIVCSADAFVGRKKLLYALGCIPARKFITDLSLVKDMNYAVNKLGNSILMYPEADYSLDGTATPLPPSVGQLLKMLKIPVVMIKTSGAFLRDPQYNMLQLRDVNVTANVRYVLSPEEINEKSAEELNDALKELFTFDNFREQQQNGVIVDEPFRADGLHRVLYKCPCCQTEGQTVGKGTTLTCNSCGKTWELTETDFLRATDGEDIFNHIPDWYAWERRCVVDEIRDGTYRLDIPVQIRTFVDSKSIYTVGEGRLTHTAEGFHLVGCGGKLDYWQKTPATYSLCSVYHWYEIGDVICIGDSRALYYCFPQQSGIAVSKARFAAEELYKMIDLPCRTRKCKNTAADT